MGEATDGRLNLIIALLVIIIAILLWPLLPALLFYGVVVLFFGLLAALVWAWLQSY